MNLNEEYIHTSSLIFSQQLEFKHFQEPSVRNDINSLSYSNLTSWSLVGKLYSGIHSSNAPYWADFIQQLELPGTMMNRNVVNLGCLSYSLRIKWWFYLFSPKLTFSLSQWNVWQIKYITIISDRNYWKISKIWNLLIEISSKSQCDNNFSNYTIINVGHLWA